MNGTITPDFTKMTSTERLAYIEANTPVITLPDTPMSKLCKIDEPDCESCQ